jgi:hypothetical protein
MNQDDVMTIWGRMKKWAGLFSSGLCMGCFVLIVFSTPLWGQSFPAFPGSTFEQRKQAYVADQGRAWERWFPGAMVHAIWAWLESPYGNEARISEEIGYLTREGDDMGWKNAWFTGDHRTPIYALRIYLQYYTEKKVITAADAGKLKEKLERVATSPGVWCAVANYLYRYLVTAYLYSTLIENIGQVEFPNPSNDQYACPQPFTYNGRSYAGGKRYDARTIYADYLGYLIDEWLRNGTQEDFGVYYYAQLHSMAALADFAPDPVIKKKGEMLFDFLLFNWAIGFSANHPAGAHGRHYIGYEQNAQDEFPWVVFFNLYGKPDIQHRYSYADGYVFKHRFPQFLTDVVEMRNAGDDYYRIIRGNVPALGDPAQNSVLPMSHRYDYVTKNYNLGGTNLGTGWELNIDADDAPLKMWMEWADSPNSGNSEGPLFNLGLYGYQHRNAVFYAGGGKLHQWLGGNAWDEQSAESGWQFFREGKVAVAAKNERDSGALEVATLGVDYSSYDAFKTAMKTKAILTANYFIASKGVNIHEGYVDYGPEFSRLPFDRLEVWEGHVGQNDEIKVVDWENNIMAVSQNGKKLFYDFNNWTVREDGSEVSDLIPPDPPAGVQVKAP